MNAGPCTYLLGCALMRLGFPVTAGQRRDDVSKRDIARRLARGELALCDACDGHGETWLWNNKLHPCERCAGVGLVER